VRSGLVIVAGGEHAQVVAEAALSRPDLWEIIGFTDLDPEARLSKMGLRYLGRANDGSLANGNPLFILGLGAVEVSTRREAIVQQLESAGVQFATIVHATAWVSPTAVLEPGVFVSGGAIINAFARVGRHAVINTGAIVEHDVVVGDYAFVGPRAVLGGGARIGDRSYVGLGSTVRDHTSVGCGVTVGMGAVVTKDVADDLSVVGIPAKPRAK